MADRTYWRRYRKNFWPRVFHACVLFFALKRAWDRGIAHEWALTIVMLLVALLAASNYRDSARSTTEEGIHG